MSWDLPDDLIGKSVLEVSMDIASGRFVDHPDWMRQFVADWIWMQHHPSTDASARDTLHYLERLEGQHASS